MVNNVERPTSSARPSFICLVEEFGKDNMPWAVCTFFSNVGMISKVDVLTSSQWPSFICLIEQDGKDSQGLYVLSFA